ncbi:MAG: sulfatase-like hydrolase/transferase, partial [bacterium]|nr:sulfatase-like hydrolase/transferase [bacterium]
EIRYTDNAIKNLYEHLEKKGITDRLVTCVTSDHGEEFGEHGIMGRHVDIYSENTHVPLIFHGVGIPSNKVTETYVSTLDIGETILALANTSFQYRTDGINLFADGNTGGEHVPKKRKFLVIGTQLWTRSLEMVGAPFAYIYNLDRHIKWWYLSVRPHGAAPVPVIDSRLKPVPEDKVVRQGNWAAAMVPPMPFNGLGYVVFRLDVSHKEKKEAAIHVKFEIYPLFFTHLKKLPVPSGQSTGSQIQTVEIVFPMTVADRSRL